ncbi:MAG: DUF7487 domain-containing protein [Sulfuricurvum sp.]
MIEKYTEDGELIDKKFIDKHFLNTVGIIKPSVSRDYNITSHEIYNIYNSVDTPRCVCGDDRLYENFKKGYRISCGNYQCKSDSIEKIDIELNDENIKMFIKEDGNLNSKLVGLYNITTKQMYDFYNEPVRCIICNEEHNFSSFQVGYAKTCKNKCKLYSTLPKIYKTSETRKKMNIQESREKAKKTKLEIYGDENYCNTEKIKQTLLERYGDEKYINVDKTKENNLKKYGVECTFQLEQVKEKANNTKLERYGNYKYCNEDKIASTKLERYGDEKYVNVDKIKNTMLRNKGAYKYDTTIENGQCYKIKNFQELNKEEIEKRFIDKDKKLDRIGFMEYYDCKDSFMYKTLKELNIEFKRNSNMENELLKYFPGADVNNRTVIKPLELDLYFEDRKFAIEYNGLMWHSFGRSKYEMFNNFDKEDRNKHLRKTELCEEQGVQLYHVFENEWLNPVKKDIWISIINDKLGLNKKVGARKCTIEKISYKEASEFLNENHLQGYGIAKECIGLFYDEGDFYPELVSVMTFSKSRFSKMYEYEMIRFATKKGYTVQGGGSKLIKYFEKTFKPKSLVSYANRRWSTGNFYSKVGFELVNISGPNYFYFKDLELLESRNKYQKHKLEKILDIFDDSLSETVNMYNNNFRKIFDSGNLVFVKIYDKNI